jgi:hypothetical protein
MPVIAPAPVVVPVLRPNAAPPPHYYADNVLRLLRAVETQYSDILLDDEREYLQRIFRLSTGALRLYARLITRKGPLIRVDTLCYREVDDPASALIELESAHLVLANPALPADQYLALLKRSELNALFSYVRSGRKRAQIDTIAARYQDRCIRARVAAAHPICSPLGLAALAIVQILFFGDARTDLSTFVLEDLGMRRFERYPLDRRARRRAR